MSKPTSTELISKFLKFTYDRGSKSDNTERTYRNALKKLSSFLLKKEKTLSEVSMQDLLDFRNELERVGYKQNSMSLTFNVIRRFCKWLHYFEIVEANPYPQLMNWEAEETRPFVPSVKNIFKIRMMNRSALLEAAATFELILSSGLRDAEVRQIRACDIDLSYRPNDISTGKLSVYCGGKITLQKEGVVLKSKSKVTYISVIAAQLIRKLMEKHNIDPGSRVPLLPSGVNVVRTRMYKVGDVVYKGKTSDEIKEKKKDIRSAGFTDLNLDELDISESMKAKIRRRQRSEEALPEKHKEYREREFQTKEEKRLLHPHSLRHAFTCIMYFRNYHGEVANMERLRQMLGHASIGTTTIYLTELELIANDAEWRRIMLGKRGDWLAAS